MLGQQTHEDGAADALIQVTDEAMKALTEALAEEPDKPNGLRLTFHGFG
mgnify:CR=1 FL=1